MKIKMRIIYVMNFYQNKNIIFTGLTSSRKLKAEISCKDIIKKVLTNISKYTFKFAAAVYGKMVRGTFLMQYISAHYSNKVYLPIQLIREAVANNWLDSLCYYAWIKKLHHRPVIYNYSLRKIGAAINCSPTTVKTHLQLLICHKLVAISNGNLILKSGNEFHRESGLTVAVPVSSNKAEQRDLLRFAIIKRNLHTQYRKFTQKNNALLYHKGLAKSYRDIKNGIRLAKAYPDPHTLENSMQNELTLSNKKFGSLCNRSQSTGIKIQKSLNNLELIASRSRTRLIDPKSHNRREFFRLDLGSSHFLSKRGQVYKRLSNGIEIVQGDKVVFN